eukprot:6174733-Pleurochrysis_carterae.AAC.1
MHTMDERACVRARVLSATNRIPFERAASLRSGSMRASARRSPSRSWHRTTPRRAPNTGHGAADSHATSCLLFACGLTSFLLLWLLFGSCVPASSDSAVCLSVRSFLHLYRAHLAHATAESEEAAQPVCPVLGLPSSSSRSLAWLSGV